MLDPSIKNKVYGQYDRLADGRYIPYWLILLLVVC